MSKPIPAPDPDGYGIAALRARERGSVMRHGCPTCGATSSFDWPFWTLWVAFGLLLVLR
jgi:apolipoprotein N-acyltransferase